MSDNAGLLDGTRTPGIYRVLGESDSILAALRQAGWVAAVVPPADTTQAFYTQIAAVLGFGAYFGRNLDALWDCLTDLDRPTAVVLAGWTRLAEARPERWAAILAVLTERCGKPPAFAVVLA